MTPKLVEEVARAIPDDIRAQGWAVAVHNDYRLDGEAHTFWLFTKEGRAVKGEGRTDAEALDQVRRFLTLAALPAAPASEDAAEGDYVRVPREPTEEMADAGYDATRLHTGEPQFAESGFCLGHAVKIYRAMIAAAPQQQEQGGENG